MNELKLDMKVETIDGLNIYEVIQTEDRFGRFVKLKCIYFIHPEDLGDEIICNNLDQEIWIAQYLSYLYEETKFSDLTLRRML